MKGTTGGVRDKVTDFTFRKLHGYGEGGAEEKTPVYIAIGEDDEYYSSEPAKEAYRELVTLYMNRQE